MLFRKLISRRWALPASLLSVGIVCAPAAERGPFPVFPPPRAEGNRGVHTPSLVYLERGLGVEILGLTSHDCEVSGSFLHRVTLSLIWGKQGHGNLGLAPQAGREEEQGLEWR